MLLKTVLRAGLCAAAGLLFLSFGEKNTSAEEEQLPEQRSGEYSFYLSKSTPYVRLSPHRAETVDTDGKKQPRRICALYALADLRMFGDKPWDAERDGCSPAYSLTPHVSAPSGSRYAMVSPEQTVLDASVAAKLRTIVTVSYPFCTAERMRSLLVENGILMEQNGIVSARENFLTGAALETVSESELLSAVQTAIWRTAGIKGSITAMYTDTRAAGRTARTLEPDAFNGEDGVYASVGNNIRAISDWLCSLAGSGKADMPITAMTVSAVLDNVSNRMTLRVRPNGTVDADDTLILKIDDTAYALFSENGSLPVLQPDADGAYTVVLDRTAQYSSSVAVRLSGTQHTAKDICLYRPSNGDVQQSLVGVFGGTVEVSLGDTVKTDAFTERARLRCMTELLADGPKIPLADATFSLYLADTSQGMTCVLSGLQTDREGLVDVQHLRTPKKGESYLFIPTDVPEGYLISEGMRIRSDSAAAVQALISSASKASAHLSLSDDNGTGLADIPFALYRVLSPSEEILLAEYSTNAQGEISVSALPTGRYCFRQLSVSEGYAAEITEHPFSVQNDGSDIRISAKNLAYRSVEGQIRFTDCDAPASVRVLLLRDGIPCAEQTVSADMDWRFDFSDIPALGSYTLVQEAIAGCVTEIDGTCIVNRLRTCNVSVRQLSENGEPIAGAVFSLHRALDGAHVCTTASDTNGCLAFSSLPMGTYILRERRTPVGIRAAKDALYLVLTDPNTETETNHPLVAILQDADGTPSDGLCMIRKKKVFFGLGLRGLLPAVGLLLAISAITVRRWWPWERRPLHKRKEPHLYSGKTRLYFLLPRKTVSDLFVLRGLRKQ